MKKGIFKRHYWDSIYGREIPILYHEIQLKDGGAREKWMTCQSRYSPVC